MKIAIGADHRGSDTLECILSVLRDERCEVDVLFEPSRTACDYPDVAYPVARAVAMGEADRGVLACASGVGMCIAANKVAGIRAALVYDVIGAEISRRNNDANVLCVASDLTSGRAVEQIVQTWIRTAFDGGRHARRNRKIAAIEAGLDPTSVPHEFGEEQPLPVSTASSREGAA